MSALSSELKKSNEVPRSSDVWVQVNCCVAVSSLRSKYVNSPPCPSICFAFLFFFFLKNLRFFFSFGYHMFLVLFKTQDVYCPTTIYWKSAVFKAQLVLSQFIFSAAEKKKKMFYVVLVLCTKARTYLFYGLCVLSGDWGIPS